MTERGAPGAVLLGAETPVPGKPFTDPSATAADLETLAFIRAAQRTRIEHARAGGTWTGTKGETHWLVTPRAEELLDREPCRAIGFFGQARVDVDHGIIVSLEHAMLERSEEIAGLLSYHNVQLESGQWGNLVLFREDADTSLLLCEPRHAEAIGRAPSHYHSLRLHRGLLADGPLGAAELELRTTLYLDFDVAPPWRAVRTA